MSEPLLELHAVDKAFGKVVIADGIDLMLHQNEGLGIIGLNGAGKSNFMKAMTGLIATDPEMILIDGQHSGGRDAHKIISKGIAMVPEGRRLFASLSVEENLLIGTHANRKGPWTLDRVYDVFPVLKERRRLPGTSLSGGQQQMVAIGRALLSNPTTLLCDEISLGLAPVIIEDLYRTIADLSAEGLSIVIVEQDIARATSVADQVYCFMEGRVSLSGAAQDLALDDIRNAYFGI